MRVPYLENWVAEFICPSFFLLLSITFKPLQKKFIECLILKLLKSNDPLPFDAAMSIVFSDLYHKKLRSSLLVRARAAVSQKIVKLQ